MSGHEDEISARRLDFAPKSVDPGDAGQFWNKSGPCGRIDHLCCELGQEWAIFPISFAISTDFGANLASSGANSAISARNRPILERRRPVLDQFGCFLGRCRPTSRDNVFLSGSWPQRKLTPEHLRRRCPDARQCKPGPEGILQTACAPRFGPFPDDSSQTPVGSAAASPLAALR